MKLKDWKGRDSVFIAGHLSIIQVVVLVVLLTGCSKMPISKSYWKDNVRKNEMNYSGYDKKSGIRWLVYNDDNYLYLDLDTDNKTVQRNVMFSGVKLYFDTTGKKKEEVYFHFPYREGGMRARPEVQPVRMNTESRTQRVTMKMPTQALWVFGDKEYHMDMLMEKTDFQGDIKFDSIGFLKYHIAIPLKSIFLNNFHKDTDLSCGIEIGGYMRPPDLEADGFGDTQMRQGAGRPGVYPGNRQQGRNMGGSSSGQRPGSRQRSGTEIWFKTELAGPAGK